WWLWPTRKSSKARSREADMKKRLLIGIVLICVLAGIGVLAVVVFRVAQVTARETRSEIPTTRVKKGRVTIVVAARGELQGRNSEMLTAPMAGGGDLAITYLREPGELVKPGDVVAEFDTAQQEFNRRESEADLAEAEQQGIKAEADGEANQEETP